MTISSTGTIYPPSYTPPTSSLNGGANVLGRVHDQNIFFRKDIPTHTKNITVLSGQVLKQGSFVQSNTAGKAIAHTGIAESAIVEFATNATGLTIIIGGLTFTVGSGTISAAKLALAWTGLTAGTGYAAAAAAAATAGVDATVDGTFTAGTLGNWNTQAYTTGTVGVVFTNTVGITNVTDLAATGTGAIATIAKVDGATPFPNIAGVLLNDVDATAGDTIATVYTEASFWVNALVWAVDPNVDYIVKADGSHVACTAYNTGVYTDSEADTWLRQCKFVEMSGFEPLGHRTVGETNDY